MVSHRSGETVEEAAVYAGRRAFVRPLATTA